MKQFVFEHRLPHRSLLFLTEKLDKLYEALAPLPPVGYSPGNSPYSKVVLYQSDFDQGTVRIQKPGLYVLAEDIVFNPNADREFSDPSPEQADTYPPVVGGCGAYVLGFFTAVAIESNDVILDLNGHTMSQSMRHYLSQRFFSMIELASGPFIMNQGPAKFACEPISSSQNVAVMNGTIGRSSHHGIRGNLSRTGYILYDLVIKDFEIAGISLQGGQDIICKNVHVRNSLSSQSKVPVSSAFSQAMFLLRRISHAPDLESTVFGGQDGQHHFDALKAAVFEIRSKLLAGETVGDIVAANPGHAMFLLPSGQSDGSNYGVVLSRRGVIVNALPEAPASSGNETVYIENMDIQNISSKPREVLCLHASDASTASNYGKMAMVDALGAVIDVERLVHPSSFVYNSANLLTNLQLWHARHRLGTDQAGSVKISATLVDWADAGTDTFAELMTDNPTYIIRRGLDSMAHVMKGNIALLQIFPFRHTTTNITIDTIQNNAPANSVNSEFLTNTLGLDASQLESVSDLIQESHGVLIHNCTHIHMNSVSINNVQSENGTASNKTMRMYP